MMETPKETSHFEVDGWQTFYANLPWLLFALLTIVMNLKMMNLGSTITEPNTQLIALIVTAFMIIKSLVYLGMPSVHFRE